LKKASPPPGRDSAAGFSFGAQQACPLITGRSRLRRLRQFHHLRSTSESKAALKPRTVSELLAAAETHRAERQQEQQRKAALEEEQRKRMAAIAREKHLDSLKGQAEKIWTTVEALVATRLLKTRDLAVQHLIDISDLATREGSQADFRTCFERFRGGHLWFCSMSCIYT
jgi:hypothetical protein